VDKSLKAVALAKLFRVFGVEYIDNLINIKKAQTNLIDFITYTDSAYKPNWHHELICEEIDGFLEDPTRTRLMLFCPPRAGKSQIASRNLPAYAFGKNPNLEIIATSYGADLASAMNRDVKRIIDSPKYKEVFPNTTINSRNVKNSSKGSYVNTSDEFQIVNYKGRYVSSGVGGGITGKGADLALIDDVLKDMAEATSPVRKQLIYDWYTSTLYTRLSPDGKVIIIMTRWAEDDLAGRLLEAAKNDPEADQWEVISLPTLFDSSNKNTHPSDPREDGEPLWPEKFSLQKINAIMKSVGKKVWASLFQQEPTPNSGTIFKGAGFQYYKVLCEFDYITISIDCTFKESDTSDFVAIGVFGTKGVQRHLVYLVRERLEFTQTVKELLLVFSKFPTARSTIVEDKANGSAVISSLKAHIPNIISYSPTESKIARANAVTPVFEAGNFFLPDPNSPYVREHMPWVAKHLVDYIDEFKAFPYGKHDDMVDMTVQFLLKDSAAPKWLQELSKQDDPNEFKSFDQQLSDMMGWQVDTVSRPSEYDTDVEFISGRKGRF